MAQIFVQHTHHNPKSTDLTGLDFLVEYDEATAAVSIQDTRTVDCFNRDKTPTVSQYAVWLEPCWQRYSRLKGNRSLSAVAEQSVEPWPFGCCRQVT